MLCAWGPQPYESTDPGNNNTVSATVSIRNLRGQYTWFATLIDQAQGQPNNTQNKSKVTTKGESQEIPTKGKGERSPQKAKAKRAKQK